MQQTVNTTVRLYQAIRECCTFGYSPSSWAMNFATGRSVARHASGSVEMFDGEGKRIEPGSDVLPTRIAGYPVAYDQRVQNGLAILYGLDGRRGYSELAKVDDL